MQTKLLLLFEKYISGMASQQEILDLSELVKQSDNETLSQVLKNAWEEQKPAAAVFTEEEADAILKSIIAQPGRKSIVIPFYKKAWFRVAAACLFIVTMVGVYKIVAPVSLKKSSDKNTIAKNKILPGSNKAVLTLADGTQVILDSTASGAVSQQGNMKVLKLNAGELAYEAAANSSIDLNPEILYNVITTPKGGQYQVVLADGSKVWLNAGSSLRFPTSFKGSNERLVTLTGEAYFEVAKNQAMPFRVSISNGEQVEVLGTHFNIMAYSDEANSRTTLLEGSVKIKNGTAERIIKPGQQAVMNSDGKTAILDNVNIDHEVAWKNGLFDFENDNLQDIMRQLSRWYDAEIVYTGSIPQGHYVGAIRRQSNISEVLKMLELAGDVDFSISGDKIIVKNNK